MFWVQELEGFYDTHNLVWSPSKCQKFINSNQRVIWLSYMHMYLIFDQAFGNEPKKIIFRYMSFVVYPQNITSMKFIVLYYLNSMFSCGSFFFFGL
jgi:hypothetical protein